MRVPMLVLVLFCFVSVEAQEKVEFTMPDTLKVLYTSLIDQDEELRSYQDTTLGDYFYHVDPLKERPFEAINLGNIGSAAYDVIYRNNHQLGFNTGIQAYRDYHLTERNVKLFNTNAPILNVKFSPIGDESNFVVKTDFGRSFTDQSSISINYQRIKQDGIYKQQSTYATSFGGAITIGNQNDRYHAILSLISNVNEEIHNGGVKDITILSEPVESKSLIDVNLSGASSRYQERTVKVANHFKLISGLSLRYDIGYRNNYYKFSDTNPAASYYGSFLTDDRGIRYYGKFNTLLNKAEAKFQKIGLDINAGFIYNHVSIDDESVDDTYHDGRLYGKTSIPIYDEVSVDAEATIGLLDNSGNFDILGRLDVNLGDYISFEGGVLFYRHPPAFIHEHLNTNTIDIYRYDFVKPLGFNVDATFTIPRLNASIIFKQTVENNSIYIGKNLIPEQYDGAFTATTIGIHHHLRYRWLGWENAAMYQLLNENIYALPSLYLKSNLYLEKRIFKGNMLARLGGEIRLMDRYPLPGYNPIIGNFYLTDQSIDLYPRLDLYFTAKVQKFRFIARFRNLINQFQNAPEVLVKDYPQFDSRLRIGIAWMFLN